MTNIRKITFVQPVLPGVRLRENCFAVNPSRFFRGIFVERTDGVLRTLRLEDEKELALPSGGGKYSFKISEGPAFNCWIIENGFSAETASRVQNLLRQRTLWELEIKVAECLAQLPDLAETDASVSPGTPEKPVLSPPDLFSAAGPIPKAITLMEARRRLIPGLVLPTTPLSPETFQLGDLKSLRPADLTINYHGQTWPIFSELIVPGLINYLNQMGLTPEKVKHLNLVKYLADEVEQKIQISFCGAGFHAALPEIVF